MSRKSARSPSFLRLPLGIAVSAHQHHVAPVDQLAIGEDVARRADYDAGAVFHLAAGQGTEAGVARRRETRECPAIATATGSMMGSVA